MKRSLSISWLPAIIILAAMSLASYWVFLVPIFQEPDEDYHADYVFSLYSRKRLILGREASIAAVSHPFIPYLLKATNGQAVKFAAFATMPKSYGTREFFQSIDRHAPDNEICAHVHTNPFVVAMYPIGYYALTALWLGLLSNLNHNLSFLFFAARVLSVILLTGGLTLSYLIMRELGLSYWPSCLVLAAIGFFPLTSFTGSYIQPDNLSFFIGSICLFLALRWRNNFCKRPMPDSARSNFSIINDPVIVTLGLALAILFLTKYQYFVSIGLAVIATIVATAIHSRISYKRIMVLLAVLLVPSIIAGMLQLWICWGCHVPGIDSKHWHWFPVPTKFKDVLSRHSLQALLAYIGCALERNYHSLYCLDGRTFKSFWGHFGWWHVPLVIVSTTFNDSLRSIIQYLTTAIILLTLASLLKIIVSLFHLVKKSRWRRALYIACANPVINSYFLFVLFMFIFEVITYPSFVGQGRYWYPVILSLVLAAALFAPRVFPSRMLRWQLFYIITIAWLCYSGVGAYYALACIHKGYYEPDKQPVIDFQQLQPVCANATYYIDDFNFVDANTTFIRHINPMTMPLGDDMIIQGWAVDILADSPASAVLLFVDNSKMYRATYGLESPEAVEKLHDSNYRFSGFGALIPTKDIGIGTHHLSMKVVSANGHLLYNTDANISFPIK